MIENTVMLLIAVPILFSLLFVALPKSMYKYLAWAFFIIGVALSVNLVLDGTGVVEITEPNLAMYENIVLIFEVLVILFILAVSAKYKNWPTLVLGIISAAIFAYTFTNVPHVESASFNIDQFSQVMILIVNIVGTAIILFATGYMDEYEEHRHLNRQKTFYFTMSFFLAAMNGLVMVDTLGWLFLFWELTTLCSFVLISYNMDEEGINNGFRALALNLVGGIALSVGIIILATNYNIGTLSGIGTYAGTNAAAMATVALPVVLLCIGAFAKSAQMPFQSWLLGAMVAPTPVSALLHSSTMVNAGVFLVVKLVPAFAGTSLGTAIAVYGSFTFVMCSALALSQRNAKRVLAYSTIANLGLIIASAGIGTPLAVAAAIMLILFHAISKALLFLCTGEIEHTIGSRDIEDMSGLINKAPLLTTLAALGMVSMLLPPFGVLLTKWVSMEAAASNPVVIIFLILGSALTTVYYAKWMGTILSTTMDKSAVHHKKSETYFPLSFLGLAIVVTSILVFTVYDYFVRPQVEILLKAAPDISGEAGQFASEIGAFAYAAIFAALVLAILIYFATRNMFTPRKVDYYMCGENNLETDKLMFRNGLCAYDKSNVSNIYLQDIFGESKLTTFGYAISILLIMIAFLAGGVLI
ncbi:ech hydrogenase subunit A [Methanosarcina thermophila]|jgi:ech hydrogenase subunit A|uniref:Ech hydrogenase subunit n=3 Tax=Methanosarcina thermophila TaxID=2210 RepID=A0A1I6YHZ1_METTE|nr:proton-conducting transporter membrane subunit [Methanosarcina thermophila]ALK05288.1 MAG: ech hydrogenase subunit [Methanosarcina sp. 795]AKB14063.1 Energy-conserving hydrogenase (ferredoxin), subunit A [Methanosarcina thermophila TM-1]AKB15293.1 Energy-conserving hydrogenase (ferredoxin), subunit A [Methanosarcina thermophila CHTI-55]NLU56246.1 ech hydrogenase subunit [Methanosarcina thermophila]SFT50135.1 ech hydrogenase subunit A [Methanosarcina thermophila]